MARQQATRPLTDNVFTLTTETAEIPLVVTTEALADFREHGLDAMNEVLASMTARHGCGDAPHTRRTLVAEMMLEGLDNDNTRKLILCALWLVHHFPDMTGLVSRGGAVRFLGTLEPDAHDVSPCAAQA